MNTHTTTPLLTNDQVAEPDVRSAMSSAVQKPRSVPSTDLLKGLSSVLIEHNGTSYRLQTTKLGKLILTK
jgi:hemin uptake protein HemP